MIEETRKKFQEEKSTRSPADLLPAIPGLSDSHPYSRQQKAAPLLLQEGRLVMACVSEADEDIFEPGESICRCAAVVSPDPFFDDLPNLLAEIAVTVSCIRDNPQLPEEYQALLPLLNGESDKPFFHPIPQDITYQKEAFLTTIYLYRPHLPLPLLYRGFFPVLICPEKTPYAMVLPAHFWDDELKAAWLEEHKG